MSVYAALLRGINVGGQRRVNMAELKAALSQAGFTGVQTYIQSGNVLFDAEGDAEFLRKRLEEILLQLPLFICFHKIIKVTQDDMTDWQVLKQYCTKQRSRTVMKHWRRQVI